jgi:hypothetical protein
MRLLLPALLERLAEDQGAGWSLEWLAKERPARPRGLPAAGGS